MAVELSKGMDDPVQQAGRGRSSKTNNEMQRSRGIVEYLNTNLYSREHVKETVGLERLGSREKLPRPSDFWRATSVPQRVPILSSTEVWPSHIFC